jgi:hypothetical protein
MLQNPMMKQMIDFQKTTFENSFNAMTGLQEQGEKVMETFLNQATWLPNEGKKAVLNWVDAFKKGRDQFKQTVELNFSKMESGFGAAGEKKK